MDADLMDRWCALGPIWWGYDDCVPLVADEVLMQTGTDPILPLRRADGGMPYRTRAERDDYLRQHGGNLPRLILLYLDGCPMFKRCKVKDAQAGTIGLGKLGVQWALGMALGDEWWIFRADRGATVLPAEFVGRAWTAS